MDFGIARVVADVGTVTQTVTGTPQYLSPEHARGEQVDARSDLYSTGCLLFELVTGRTPFLADSGYAMAVKHITEPAPAPSSVNPDIPPVLDQIIGQTLAKDRGARYQTAAQLRADLEAVATGTVPSLAPLAADGSPAGAPATEAIVMQRTAPMPPPQPLAPPAPAPPHPAVMNPAAAGVPTHAAALTPSVAQPQGVAAQPHEAAAPGVGAATGRLGPGAPVSPPAGPPPWVVAPTATVPAATGRSGGRRWWFAAAAVVALALVGTGVWWFGFHSTGGGGQPEASVGPYDTRFDADKASYTRADLEASVIDVDTSSAVTVFDTRGTVAVQSLDGTITALPQTTQVVGVTLAADSSFKSGSFGLTDPAQKELAGLSVKIPYGATVDVDGYTDSVNGEDINLPLSEGWAQAVADRLAEFRPDLVLTVTGHGSDKPVAKDTYDDGTDNPSGQAKNRRVEISYEE
jgi:outer membrane protein OmpA-like peptidoglycan-associated protein